MSVGATEGVGTSYFGGTSATAGSTDSSSTAATTQQVDKDMFLKLMVTQLRNQDPMNPTDSSQFLAQTAQFTSLEKLTSIEEQASQALSAQLAFGASGLVGKSVDYTDATGAQTSGKVDSVSFTATGPVLSIGGTDVSLSSVVGVTG
jgi:flagellar basal-body rod modification protein FlgD